MRLLLSLMLLLAVVCLTACGPRYKVGKSLVGETPPDALLSIIAQEAAEMAASAFVPDDTALYVVSPDGEKVFSPLLREALRGKGFSVSKSKDPARVAVAYSLDLLQGENAWYLQLRMQAPDEEVQVFVQSYPLPSPIGVQASSPASSPVRAIPQSGLRNEVRMVFTAPTEVPEVRLEGLPEGTP